ncbi:hypothetical protein KIL84_018271 [Mauremys mutica]|uniref:Uncharacterized protein n=1 Tax=Mauremys mutica TaxID=74926 RepID=A0A9D3XTC6_9SAUR|nr:hypothetical protein KIL84_018271 [Mauremys mutica]
MKPYRTVQSSVLDAELHPRHAFHPNRTPPSVRDVPLMSLKGVLSGIFCRDSMFSLGGGGGGVAPLLRYDCNWGNSVKKAEERDRVIPQRRVSVREIRVMWS